jgi:hypothetical protein
VAAAAAVVAGAVALGLVMKRHPREAEAEVVAVVAAVRVEEDRVLRLLLRRPVGSRLRQLRLRRRPARASAI